MPKTLPKHFLAIICAAVTISSVVVPATASAGATKVKCPVVSASGRVTPALKLNGNYSGCNFTPKGAGPGNRSRAHLVFGPSANLSGANLSWLSLIDINLSKANLSGADLTGSSLARANLTSANLTGAILNGVTLTGAKLTSAKLTGVLSSGIYVDSSINLPADWYLIGGYLFGPNANLSGIGSLACEGGCGGSSSGLSTRFDLQGLNLRGVDLSNSSVSLVCTNSDFTGANLSSTHLAWIRRPWSDDSSQSYCAWSNFTNANLSNRPSTKSGSYERIQHDNFTGANFSHADLSEEEYAWSIFVGDNLTTANLNQTRFYESNLTNVNFTGQDLRSTTFFNANLTGANLSRTNLVSVDLQSSILSGANLTGANLSLAILPKSGATNIVGIPSALPDGWTLTNGRLIPPVQ